MICADVGGSFVDIANVSETGAIDRREKLPTPTDDWRAFVGVFADYLAVHAGAEMDLDCVAIATAGLVDPDSGQLTSANIPAIHGRNLQGDLSDVLGREVVLINDADAFVLAEARFGVARGHRRVFGIILGTGVGGGLIDRGVVLSGAGGVAGEWGHGQVITRSPTSPGATPYFRCGCGRWGCLDTVGGARGMERLHRFLHSKDATSRDVVEGWRLGDALASATIDTYCDLVAGPLAMALNAFPATVVPVGGGLSSAHDLVSELDRRVRVQMLNPPARPLLLPSGLGSDAGLLGALIAGRAE
jgi:N-acetylglucosamine kinase